MTSISLCTRATSYGAKEAEPLEWVVLAVVQSVAALSNLLFSRVQTFGEMQVHWVKVHVDELQQAGASVAGLRIYDFVGRRRGATA